MKKNIYLVYTLVTILIIGTGVSFAYFLSKANLTGTGASNVITSNTVGDTTLTMAGSLPFTNTGIMPGHKNISKLTLTATGTRQVIYSLIWEGTNSFATLNYTVYKSSYDISPSISCTQKETQEKQANGSIAIKYYEECTNNNFTNIGSIVATGSISKNTSSSSTTLTSSDTIQATTSGAKVYYYIVLEFPNNSSSQNTADSGANFTGGVKAKVLEEA